MEQGAVNVLFIGGAGELLDYKMYRLPKYQDFTRGLVRNLIKLAIFTEQITLFLKQQAEKAVASKMKFRQDISWEKPVKEEVTTCDH